MHMSEHDQQIAALAEQAAAKWGLAATALEPVSSGGNIIYRARLDHEAVYLRLTEPDFRTVAESQAECDFLDHLERHGVRLAAPIPSRDDRVVEPLETPAGFWSASLFTEAPGRHVVRTDAFWSDTFVEDWGRALGRIHRAATTFEPVSGWERSEWDEDFWLRQAALYLPPAENRSRLEYERVMAYFQDLPTSPTTYGMTHGDFAPANFRYTPDMGITVFDFGNCGNHWFMWDVAVSLSIVLWEADDEKEAFRRLLVDGYTKEFGADALMFEHLDWFLRLRMLVVYLSRHWWFGADPTPEQQVILQRIRANIDTPVSWSKLTAPTWRG